MAKKREPKLVRAKVVVREPEPGPQTDVVYKIDQSRSVRKASMNELRDFVDKYRGAAGCEKLVEGVEQIIQAEMRGK